MNFASPAPDFWTPELAEDSESELSSDTCVIKGQAFFVHGLIEIPVTDADDVFSWGVWVSLSQDNFTRALRLWDTPGRQDEPPYFGWLSTSLPLYAPTTIDLKTRLHTRPVGERPFIELEPTDHPLAVEQRTGITRARVQQIAELLLHPEQRP
ncbi:DUF2199 domain-containing protein [Actinomadura meridiana]|uniref:DUF2199 domain-containing protein n=2 Tax=Actinomadura meridiana TaxID=559626 RepID=A0ABP8CEC3_9ACTN